MDALEINERLERITAELLEIQQSPIWKETTEQFWVDPQMELGFADALHYLKMTQWYFADAVGLNQQQEMSIIN